ncbi:MAG TPA: alpha/beta fold hydrolase [Acidothermales bacterium]
MTEQGPSPVTSIQLLGPVRLGYADGSSAPIRSDRERTLLAALASDAGLVVSADALIDAVWGNAPPAGVRHALHVHVSALRRRLGHSPSPLEAAPHGYVLRLGPNQLDSEAYEALAARGRAEFASNEPDRAAGTFREALALWRGPAMADVPWERFAAADVARLTESRHSTEEDQVDAELAAGNTDVAASLASGLVQSEPLRERRWGQLMLSLYRSGRQADAVQRFTEVRALLRAELGVDPSPELQQLHRGILDQDEQLGLVDSRIARTPQTLFTRVADCALAYQVLGNGPIDVVLIPGFTGHLEVRWEDPVLAHLYRRLGRACRLVLMDKRGTGMSDRFGGFPPLPEHVDDVIAVMDAVGSRHFAIFGVLDGATIGLLTAVAHPERVIGLATYTMLPVVAAPDYPYSAKPEQAATLQTVVSQRLDMDAVLPLWAPSRVGDVEFSRWFTRYMRMGAGVGGAAQIVQRLLETDIRAQLADVDVPVLVLHRRGDRANNPGNAEYLAAHLSQATLALLPGDDTVLWAGDVDAVAAAIEDWLPTLSSGR